MKKLTILIMLIAMIGLAIGFTSVSKQHSVEKNIKTKLDEYNVVVKVEPENINCNSEGYCEQIEVSAAGDGVVAVVNCRVNPVSSTADYDNKISKCIDETVNKLMNEINKIENPPVSPSIETYDGGEVTINSK